MDLFSWTLLSATVLYVAMAAAFAVGLSRRRSGGSTCGASAQRPFVSVIVAARNEEACIGSCLDGLVRQTYPEDQFEVLVVDDDSVDGTCEIVRQFASRHPGVRSIPMGHGYAGFAAKKRPMSVGITAARGDIILTTDADCRVPTSWVERVVAYFDTDVGAVIGFSQVKERGCRLSLFERLQGFDFLALMSAAAGAANLGVPLAASGQNLAYRKTLFDRVGGFESIAHRPSGDDVLLIQLMRRSGYGRIVFGADPGSFVSTWRPESLAGLWHQRVRWASNAAYQIRLNPLFFVYIAAVFLVNTLAPLGLIAGTFGTGRLLPLACWGAKALADLTVTWKGARAFGRQDLLWALPLWEILQAPYVVLVGIAGSLTGFTWKGRRHR